jgi:methylmalonyl-CoA/ethylmalonyl-CoA epimerase
MFNKIRAIHLAVNNLKEAAKNYEECFGFKVDQSGEIPSLGIRNAILKTGDITIEMLEPINPSQGLVAKFLQERGEGIYMMAWEVDDVDETVKALQSKGVQLRNAEPRKKGVPVIIQPKSAHGIMIELIEKSK